MDHHQQVDEQQAPCVPPGFRFHPTEEELVGYYLARKVASQKIDLDIIREVDLYRIEPWDLQERCGRYAGSGGCGAEEEDQPTELYFFSYKDRKYPSGTRTNRATAAGFWKATGRDKPVLSSKPAAAMSAAVIGMRKTLVFYRGRAPNGRKTDWIIHEYRLQSSEHAPPQEEGWVVCRAFQKPMPNHHHHQRPSYCGFVGAGGYPDPGSYAAANAPGYDAAPNNSNNAHARLLLAPESKLQVQLIADMPPLQSPAAVDGVHQSYEQAAAAESAVDWSLLNSLLPSAQLNFHHQPPASPPSCAKNNGI